MRNKECRIKFEATDISLDEHAMSATKYFD